MIIFSFPYGTIQPDQVDSLVLSNVSQLKLSLCIQWDNMESGIIILCYLNVGTR